MGTSLPIGLFVTCGKYLLSMRQQQSQARSRHNKNYYTSKNARGNSGPLHQKT
jgi:hypothetical protein